MTKAAVKLLDAKGQMPDPKDSKRVVEVDFNPQTLRLSYRTSGGSGTMNARDKSEGQAQTAQPTNYNDSLSVELLFDTSTDGTNVRSKTSKIANMIKAVDKGEPPLIVFQWGDFLFRGVIQSMDETIDFFTEDGVPLRATVNLSISGNCKDMREPNKVSGAGAGAGAGAGFSAGASFGASAGFSASAGVSASLNASAGKSLSSTFVS